MRACCTTLFAAWLWFIALQPVMANDKRPLLADEQELPDQLIETTEPEGQRKSYGSERIVIQKGGVKDTSQVTPDPLERSVTQPPKDQGEEVEIKLFESEPSERDKAQETPDPLLNGGKAGKKRPVLQPEKTKRDELVTPDPLLDNVER